MDDYTPERLQAEFKRLGWTWNPRGDLEFIPNEDQLKCINLGLTQPLPTIGMKAPQLLAYNFGITHPKFILSLDKGMGKTITYLAIGLEGQPEYVIICCPTNAMASQRREILRHFPFYADKFTFVRGQAAQRYKQWRTPGCRIFICTVATLQTDLGGRVLPSGGTSTSILPKWATSTALDHLSLDEFQKYIRTRSKTLDQLKRLQPATLIPDSGSPVSRGPHELYPALHLIDRKFWSSYWKYVGMFCETEEGWSGKGKKIVGPKNVDGWRRAIAPYVFHRKKDPRDYPPKSRNFLELPLHDWQRKLHDDLRNNLMASYEQPSTEQEEVTHGFLIAKNTLDALFRARLGLICPKALDPTLGYGSGIEGIEEDAAELSHYVISTPFRAPVPHLKAYLESKGRKVYVLMGGLGIDPDQLDNIIRTFERDGGVLIQTIKYATSYEFLQPEHQYFLGYEYDPEDNKQAEDRMSRLSSTKPCFMWYVKFRGTYDEDLAESLIMHGRNVHTMLNKGKYWDTGEWG